ncbi:uncharacterized protein LOC116249879 [Nymphaea colorata]|uniref:uncharacterized protein LOC116249879 n=1 Tax=Nymphaea colorata TaxID=210225 RepID=UPI00129DDC10|nr:uncharacterized protein LOC116249879 [Nymphaea colorata]
MFCKSASQLLKELAYNDNDQLTPFNNDIFEQVFRECDEHHLHLQSLMRKIQDDGLDIQTTRNSDHFGAVIHHLSLIRNKRCLMAYMYNRAEIIRSLRWKIGTILPEEIQSKLNYSEEEYFKNHCAALEVYMSEIDLDLTVDMIPPKDPSIQVRVRCDIGDVLLGDQVASLTNNSVHLMKRTDAEQFISQGLMEEFT